MIKSSFLSKGVNFIQSSMDFIEAKGVASEEYIYTKENFYKCIVSV